MKCATKVLVEKGMREIMTLYCPFILLPSLIFVPVTLETFDVLGHESLVFLANQAGNRH